MGLRHVVAPLFELRPLNWTPPDRLEIDSVLLTSANAARFAGEALGAFLGLPCYVVGEATAVAARAAGFGDVTAGDRDGAAVLKVMAQAGMRRPLHLCGREHIPLGHPELRIDRRIVYAAEAVQRLPQAVREAAQGGAVVLLHSPRAATHLGKLLDQEQVGRANLAVAAMSDAVAAAAGSGWRAVEAAARPSDEALLELAAKLCKTGGSETGNAG